MFQSFPFLDAAHHAYLSCFDFVWNFLPQYQARTPQYFESSAEKVLEDEMDTDATRVVRGDGTETGEGRETITETPPEATRVGSYRKLHPPRYQSPTPSLEEPSWGSMYASTSSLGSTAAAWQSSIHKRREPSPADDKTIQQIDRM